MLVYVYASQLWGTPAETHTSVTALHTCVCMLACLLAKFVHITQNVNGRGTRTEVAFFLFLIFICLFTGNDPSSFFPKLFLYAYCKQ